jgi:hypothetical protein
MSQFNQTTPPPPQNSPAKKNSSLIYWVVIVVLLIGCVYLFWRNNKEKDQAKVIEDKQKVALDSVVTDRNLLQKDFDAASGKIDQLVSTVAKQDSALQGDKVAMEKLRGQIKTILNNKNATQAELKKAREMITELTGKSRMYEERIALLEKENQQLTGEKVVLTRERDSTVEKNIAMKKAGSVLGAANIRMEAIHKRRNGKEKETSKAKKADILRITFDIVENRIAESGTKQIYLRILAPGGAVLSTPSNASGVMTGAKGESVQFSVLKNIMLTQGQPVKDLMVDWNQDGDYTKGSYYIEVWSEGYKVGSGNVKLK